MDQSQRPHLLSLVTSNSDVVLCDVSQCDWRCVMKSWGGVMASLMKWAADRPKHLLACTLSLFSRQSNLPSNISREMHLQLLHPFSDYVKLCSSGILRNAAVEKSGAIVVW